MRNQRQRSVRNVSVIALICVATGVVRSAQSTKFQAERAKLHQEAVKARAALGVDLLDPKLDKLYPYSQIQPVKVQKLVPGAGAAVALTGKFPPGATVLSDRDGAVLSGAALSATSYSARVTIGATEGPGFVKLWAFTPVHHVWTVMPVVFIDTIYRFDLKGADGLTVKLSPTEKTFTLSNSDKDARLKYQADFYKPGEAKPFETRTAMMSYFADEDPRTRLDITVGDPPKTNTPEQEMEEIGKKLSDPKLTGAERDALMARMGKAQQRMIEDMLKGATAEAAAAADKKTDDFGCRLVQVYPGAAGSVSRASVMCGKNFYKGAFETTGTMTVVR